MRERTKKKSSYQSNSISTSTSFIFHLCFWIFTCACIVPIILVLSVSFTDEQSIIANGYHFFPQKFSFTAYQYLFIDQAQIVKSYAISIFVTVVGTVLSLLIIAMFAYPVSREDLPYRNVFVFLLFFTVLFNGGLVPWYILYVRYLHLQDSIWALIIPLLIQPFFVLIMKTFFATSIPNGVVESAKIDGAGEFYVFWKIIIPLSLPVLATIGLFDTILYWNDWFLSLIFITDNSTVSLQYLMYKTLLNIEYLTSNTQAADALNRGRGNITLPSESIRMAMCIIGIGPIVLAYPFFQKYFIKGLTIGAVKG